MMHINKEQHHRCSFQAVGRKLSGKGGFTLVELIVVLVIMGILTAAIIPTVTGYVAEAKVKVAASDMHMVEQAARLYLTDWETNGDATASDLEDLTAEDLVDAGYLSALGDTDYDITFTKIDDGNRYIITVTEKESTSGDAGDQSTT